MILGTALSIVTSGVVGSAIGGVTNDLAIRMLFHPYEAKHIGKWQVPFTPGILPKRREELAVSLGETVESYLMTPEMMREKLSSPKVEEQLSNIIVTKWNEFQKKELKIRDLLEKYNLENHLGTVEEKIKETVTLHVTNFVKTLEEKEIAALVGEEKIEELKAAHIPKISNYVLRGGVEYIESEQGEVLIKGLTENFLTNKGRLGGVVNFLVKDSSSLNNKIRKEFISVLEDDKSALFIGSVIEKEVGKLLVNKVSDFIHIKDEQITQLIDSKVDGVISTNAYLDKTIAECFPQIDEWVTQKGIPTVVKKALQVLNNNIEQLFNYMDVAGIVKEQVDKFPVSKLEELLLGVSKKEFKMITIFGFVTGGVIGVLQGLLQQLF